MRFDYKKSEVKKVGDKLRHHESLTDYEERVLAAYRIGHRSIIESFRNQHKQMLEKDKWKNKGILFASRLKKRRTLVDKLSQREQEMGLVRMHDVAGCRLIFLNLDDMIRYRDSFVVRQERKGLYAHLRNDGRYDYILTPRPTGYRGIHDIYEEISTDGVKAKIEVQYRTITQHAWATALEIWDQTHSRGAKFGLEDPQIQQLFKLYAELLWRFKDSFGRQDRRKLDMSDTALYHEIRELERTTHILSFLSGLPKAAIDISVKADEILLHRFEKINSGILGSANLVVRQLTWEMVGEDLFRQELDDSNDLVFVQTDPKHLKRAYNNYFNDAMGFVRQVRRSMTTLYSQLRFRFFRNPLDAVFVMPPKKDANRLN